VLDVAAGAGDPALAIARLVGPTGGVTATDGVPEMLAALQAAASREGLGQITTRLAPAEALELPPASHDAACSRFGVMFFADPLAALSGMARAVRAGGRLVVVAWGAADANPYFTATMEALDAAGAPSLPAQPGIKTVFEFAEPGRLLRLAQQAGWRQAQEEVVPLTMTLPDTAPEGALDLLARLSRKVESRLAGLDAAALDRARAAVARRLQPFARGGDIAFPAQALIVSGRA
jgi:ubiquinone/menaquinone biosynthesis C-methylase UbiE